MEQDRPLECAQCTKELCVVYKEIANQTVTTHSMCADCPILEKHLHGSAGRDTASRSLPKGLCCNGCQTSLQDVQAGQLLGCTQCYAIFGEAIFHALDEAGLVAPHMGNSLHVGRTPYDGGSVLSSKKITELNEELNAALASENYEEAAWLRDQIKTLMEESHE